MEMKALNERKPDNILFVIWLVFFTSVTLNIPFAYSQKESLDDDDIRFAVENNLIVEDEWEYKSDWAIKEDIEDEFFWSFVVDEDDVGVQVSNGTAILSGEVASRYEAQAAVKNAFEGGARSVENNITIQTGYPCNGRKNQGFDWWCHHRGKHQTGIEPR